MPYNKKRKLSYGSVIHGRIGYGYRDLSISNNSSTIPIISTPINEENVANQVNFQELFNDNDMLDYITSHNDKDN